MDTNRSRLTSMCRVDTARSSIALSKHEHWHHPPVHSRQPLDLPHYALFTFEPSLEVVLVTGPLKKRR